MTPRKGVEDRGWLQRLRASDQEILIGCAIYLCTFMTGSFLGMWRMGQAEK
jgi:hypothetical protein